MNSLKKFDLLMRIVDLHTMFMHRCQWLLLVLYWLSFECRAQTFPIVWQSLSIEISNDPSGPFYMGCKNPILHYKPRKIDVSTSGILYTIKHLTSCDSICIRTDTLQFSSIQKTNQITLLDAIKENSLISLVINFKHKTRVLWKDSVLQTQKNNLPRTIFGCSFDTLYLPIHSNVQWLAHTNLLCTQCKDPALIAKESYFQKFSYRNQAGCRMYDSIEINIKNRKHANLEYRSIEDETYNSINFTWKEEQDEVEPKSDSILIHWEIDGIKHMGNQKFRYTFENNEQASYHFIRAWRNDQHVYCSDTLQLWAEVGPSLVVQPFNLNSNEKESSFSVSGLQVSQWKVQLLNAWGVSLPCIEKESNLLHCNFLLPGIYTLQFDHSFTGKKKRLIFTID